jgi:ribosome-associated toxin RatA of RatAB toxin-antitoxin module
MYTEHAALVRAELEHAFEYAADVEQWPAFMPHYRGMKIERQDGNRRLVRMAARHLGIPLSWVCEQEVLRDEQRIRFHHVGGITDGMRAEWRFTSEEGGVRVAVSHDFKLRWPLIGGIATAAVAMPVFVGPISGKTLQRVKAAAEARTARSSGTG